MRVRTIVSTLILTFPLFVVSQPLQLEWVVDYPCYSPMALEYDKVLTDEAQNVYLCGAARSSINTLYGSAILTQQYDSTGSLLWESKFDNKEGDKFYDCAFDGNGNFLVAGSKGCISATNPCRAEIVSYEMSSGSENWHTFIFDTIQEAATLSDIDVDGMGNVYAFGQYSNDLTQYDSNKMFVAKIQTQTGEVEWQRVFTDEWKAIKGKVLEDKIRIYGYKILGQFVGTYFLMDVDFDGNLLSSVYLPQISYGPGIFDPFFFFDNEGFLIGFGYDVVKFGMSENTVWTFDFARGLPNTIGQAMTATVDEEGNIYASGYIKDTITTEEFTQTIKLSPAGDLLWVTVDKFSDETDFERGQEIAVSPYHVFVSSMIGYNTPAGPAAQKLDYRPILYSQTDGSILYDTLIDVNIHDFHDYAHYGKGHFYLLGRSYLPSSSDPDDYRYQLFKFGVEEPSPTSGQVEQGVWADVFPNPTNGSLTISQPEKQYFDQAALYDAKGRLVHSCLLTGQEQKLLLPELAAGVYSLELKGNSAILTKRIVIQP